MIEAIQLKEVTITKNFLKLQKKLYHNHDKYITTQEFNILIAENFVARVAQAKLAVKLILMISQKKQILMKN